MKRIAILLTLASTALLAPLAAQAPALGAVAPVVTVNDLSGKPVRIVVAPGHRAAVIEFWATWCEICHALLPEMRAAHQRFGDRVDFYGVDVTVNDPLRRVARYVAENHPPFVALYDDKGAAVRAFGAEATSHVVIVDAHGRIAYAGDGSDQRITAELTRMLGQ